jgi:hypothetical protein
MRTGLVWALGVNADRVVTGMASFPRMQAKLAGAIPNAERSLH